eukprot:SAG11_NODE_8604_length_996_cov_1.061315_2_plen_96_part_00
MVGNRESQKASCHTSIESEAGFAAPRAPIKPHVSRVWTASLDEATVVCELQLALEVHQLDEQRHVGRLRRSERLRRTVVCERQTTKHHLRLWLGR